MLKIKDNDFSKWKQLGFKQDDSSYYESSYYKELHCYYNEINPKLMFGTLFTDGDKLNFYKGGNFKNSVINVNNFMQKIVDEEISKLKKENLIEEIEEKEK